MRKWFIVQVRLAAIVLAALLCGETLGAQGADAQLEERPNILFAIADDWSFGHAGAYGCRWVKTPGFDRVAREGLLFTRAYTPNAKCAPSRACILTGRNSWQLEEAANHICYFPPKFKTWAETLGEHGYTVGMTGKGWAPGVANDAQGKPRQMTGKPYNSRRAPKPAGGISPNDYAGNFEEFLEGATVEKPWCFWYGAAEPHRGYEYGSGVAKGGKRLSDVDHVPGYWPDNETVRNDMLDYALEVEHFDRHLVRMLDLLAERGKLENTLVVVTSDHGMPFPRVKGQAYEASNHVPLAMMWKRGIAAPGRALEDYVSFVDLAPTFVDLAGIKWQATGMAETWGLSLRNFFFTDQSGRVDPRRGHVLLGKERHDIGRPHDWGYPIRGIVRDDMLLIENFETSRWPAGNPETGYLNCDGGPTKTEVLKSRTSPGLSHFWELCFGKRPALEFYDLTADPDCLVNLAERSEHAELRDTLKAQLQAELEQQQDPRMFGQGEVFDKYLYANPGGRNFYEKHMRGETPKAGWVNESDFESEPLD